MGRVKRAAAGLLLAVTLATGIGAFAPAPASAATGVVFCFTEPGSTWNGNKIPFIGTVELYVSRDGRSWTYWFSTTTNGGGCGSANISNASHLYVKARAVGWRREAWSPLMATPGQGAVFLGWGQTRNLVGGY